MPRITLPDGTTKDYPAPLTARQVAESIGAGLAKAAVGAKVNGELTDLDRPIEGDAHVAIVTRPKKNQPVGEQDPDALYLLRHSAAHVMAEAIQCLWPEAQLAYGPPLENGFYYDIALEKPISSEDFPKIEAKMAEIVAESRPFIRYELDIRSGFQYLEAEGNKYKIDNANKAARNGAKSLSWYITGTPKECVHDGIPCWYIAGILVPKSEQTGSLIRTNTAKTPRHGITIGQKWNDFEDLCMGPHVPSTGCIGAFKITSIASSHWHGDVTSDRFQRVYGTAFYSEADLKAHLDQQDAARKRDHRILGRKLKLFHIDETVGQGLILWTPRGAQVRQVLQNFILDHLTRQGYQQVFTPHIGKLELYKTSGHFPYYQDSQYPPLIDREQIAQLAKDNCGCGELSNRLEKGDIDGYLLKPMNCPHHIKIYDSEPRSYRDLPVRLAEFGTVYRWEQSGELGGMTRVRGFTQDDAHLFVTEDQLASELLGCLELVKIVFAAVGMTDYRVRVGLRDPNSTKYVGQPENWAKAEAACRAAAESLGAPFTAEAGEAAFYGPKIDFVVKDVIGRSWQLGTVQVDYNLPERFDLSYIGADNKPHRPIMIHRAPFGSMERFIGCLIEHFEGAFPLWLAPEQIMVLPISDKFSAYGRKVLDQLRAAGLRAVLDESSERVQAKIRTAQELKVPYMLVVGGKDEAAGTVSVRDRSRGDLGALSLNDFLKQAAAEVATRGQAIIQLPAAV